MIISRRSLLLFLVLCFCSSPAYSDLASDKVALVALRSSLNGRPLLWNLSATPCSWEGVRCAGSRVIELHLPAMGLRGELPLGVMGNLTQLETLSLRLNSLSGSLPSDLAALPSLRNLYLQGNRFSGELPDFLFSMRSLVQLDLAANNFNGKISPRFNNLSRLSALYLEENHFTGSIPDLNVKLVQFNVSFNQLSGPIPLAVSGMPKSAFEGNSLCGKPLSSCNVKEVVNRKKLSSRVIIGIAIASVLGTLILILLFIVLLCFVNSGRKYATSKKAEASKQNKVGVRGERKVNMTTSGLNSLVILRNQEEEFDIEQLLKASAEVLGKGTFGTAYKASLGVGLFVAVKRMKDVNVSENEFRDRMKEIGEMEHENLVRLVAYFYSWDEKLLVHEYVPTGSLSALLHGDDGAGRTPLSWETRCRIALGAARAIAYIHSCGPSTSHGNIKSSNILLDRQYEPHVSDFGLAHIAGPNISPSRFHGYRAPEVIDVRIISQKADVYSFGVLILELVTGKAPSTSLWNEEGVDLPKWVRSAFQQESSGAKVIDVELLRYQNVEEDMVRLLQLGIECTHQYPDDRPSMAQVTQRIESLSQFISTESETS